MTYSHSQGIDEQAWYKDYLAVRVGTGDWWFREVEVTHCVAAERTTDGAQNFWFRAGRMMHAPQPFLDAVYARCSEFFRANPGLTPQTTPETPVLETAPGHIWTPPVHADPVRVEKSWAEHEARFKELNDYQSDAIDASAECPGCGPQQWVKEGCCTGCQMVLARECSCGFTNRPIEAECRSCGRRLRRPPKEARR